MSEIAKNKTTKDMLDSRHNFAMFGLIMSLLAFSLSVTTPWVSDFFASSTVAIEEVAVEEAVIQAEDTASLTDYLSLIVIMIALGGIVNGALGFVRTETRIVGAAAVLIGVAAIIAQYLLIALAILVLVILIIGILNSFGVSF